MPTCDGGLNSKWIRLNGEYHESLFGYERLLNSKSHELENIEVHRKKSKTWRLARDILRDMGIEDLDDED